MLTSIESVNTTKFVRQEMARIAISGLFVDRMISMKIWIDRSSDTVLAAVIDFFISRLRMFNANGNDGLSRVLRNGYKSRMILRFEMDGWEDAETRAFRHCKHDSCRIGVELLRPVSIRRMRSFVFLFSVILTLARAVAKACMVSARAVGSDADKPMYNVLGICFLRCGWIPRSR